MSDQPGQTFAGFWVRSAAVVVDLLLIGLVLLPLILLYFHFSPEDFYASPPTAFLDKLELMFALIIVPNLFFVTRYGATPGKMVFGLRIINGDGSIPNLGKTIKREIIGKSISGVFFSFGYYWAAFDKEKQAIHDKIAGTHVIFTKPLTEVKKLMIYFVVLLPFLIVLGGIVFSRL